jgi:hypothetical protein
VNDWGLDSAGAELAVGGRRQPPRRSKAAQFDCRRASFTIRFQSQNVFTNESVEILACSRNRKYHLRGKLRLNVRQSENFADLLVQLVVSKSCFRQQAPCYRISRLVRFARSRCPDITASTDYLRSRRSMRLASGTSIFRFGRVRD